MPSQDLTPLRLALLVFFAFAMQCISTTPMRRETGGWKCPISSSLTLAPCVAGAFVAVR